MTTGQSLPERQSGITRRRFLQGTGALVLLAGGGTLYRAITTGVFRIGQGEAFAPWNDWRVENGGILNLVRAAVLASNPHNTQPWLFAVADDQIDLYADLNRKIGATDCLLREMVIGLGCALTNLLLAARAEGYDYQLTLMPTAADPAHVAHIKLEPGASESTALYEAIPHRQTHRGPYIADKPIPVETLDTLAQMAETEENVRLLWLTAPDAKTQFTDMMVQATEAIVADEEQSIASHSWFRFDWDSVQAHRDGIIVDTSGLSEIMLALAKMVPTTRQQSDAAWIDSTRSTMPTSAAFGLLLARDLADNRQRLQVGLIWQQLNLQLTRAGLATQPINQVVERRDREVQLGLDPVFGRALDELVGETGWTAMLPFRAGYAATKANKSPRRTLEAVLL